MQEDSGTKILKFWGKKMINFYIPNKGCIKPFEPFEHEGKAKAFADM